MFPPRRVLAAVDFSEPSRVAAAMAVRLARQCGAELHVVHAEDPLLCAAARTENVDLMTEAREELTAFTAALVPHGMAVHQHVVGGIAANVICDIALRDQADVIVIGLHGMSGVERMVFGSTTEAVLRRSRIPVLLVPHTWSPPTPSAAGLSGIGPVIVGMDFTPGSFEALSAGFRLARLLDTRLELLHVVPALPVIDRWKHHAAGAMRDAADAAHAELDRVARGLTTTDMNVTVRIDTGVVAELLADAARPSKGRSPLLVLGRRLPHAHHDVPGATAYRVALLASAPTLMFMATESAE
jgi:nucleotide-binding universal stress UspA family protein